MPIPNRMTKSGYDASAQCAANHAAKAQANAAEYAGLTLERLEELADDLAVEAAGLARGTEAWKAVNIQVDKIVDAMFAITG